MRGIMVHVLRSALGDSTNGGVTAGARSCLLVGPGVPAVFEPGNLPVLRLVKRQLAGGEYLHAQPLEEERHCMAGGNFIWSSDSRFREAVSTYPIPVHDRVE